MKKFWQIKPWIFIVVILILIGSLAFALGGNSGGGIKFSANDYQSVGTRSMGISAAPGMAPAPAMDSSFGYAESASTSSKIATTPKADRMIIKTGSLSMVVDDVRKSVADITSFAEKNGGFLVTSNISKSDIDVTGNLTIRVPSKILDQTITYVKGLGDVNDEHIDGQDITEQYTDLQSRLTNLQATEKQLLKIMSNAVRTKDVLAVQRELSNVRGEIESLQGTMKYLKESVDLSSLTVYLSTNPSTLPVINSQDQWKPLAVFKDAIRSLLDFGKGIVNGLIWIAAYLPVIIVVLLIAWGIRRFIRRKKKE